MVTEAERQHSIEMLDRIELMRKRAGITKAEMYRASGTSSSALSQWRSGLTKPATKSIDALARCLGTTSKYLMFGENDEKTAITGGLSDAQAQLIELVRKATAAEVELLLAIAQKQVELRGNV